MKTKKLINLSNLWKIPSILCLFIPWIISCEGDIDSQKKGQPYDPNKPVQVTTFYPDSGIYLEKVMLEGSNFGNDASKISVYFNKKKASVIGSTGSRIYTIAPRLPGDIVTISVTVGNDSVIYPQKFYYTATTTVTTVAGNGKESYRDGDLATSELRPRYICADKEGNVFVYSAAGEAMARLDFEENELVTLIAGRGAGNPTADPITGVITVMTTIAPGTFMTFDPKEMWAPRFRSMKWKEGTRIPTRADNYFMAVNPKDGYLYTKFRNGELVRMNQQTYEAETIAMLPYGTVYGMTFNPIYPNIVFMTFDSDGGKYYGQVCSYDVRDPEKTFKTFAGGPRGYRDGPKELAMFNKPAQLTAADDGYMYLADYNGMTIRGITTDGYVETVLGIPGKYGWVDGSKDVARFLGPRGVAFTPDGSVYVADEINYRVRKLSIN